MSSMSGTVLLAPSQGLQQVVGLVDRIVAAGRTVPVRDCEGIGGHRQPGRLCRGQVGRRVRDSCSSCLQSPSPRRSRRLTLPPGTSRWPPRPGAGTRRHPRPAHLPPPRLTASRPAPSAPLPSAVPTWDEPASWRSSCGEWVAPTLDRLAGPADARPTADLASGGRGDGRGAEPGQREAGSGTEDGHQPAARRRGHTTDSPSRVGGALAAKEPPGCAGLGEKCSLFIPVLRGTAPRNRQQSFAVTGSLLAVPATTCTRPGCPGHPAPP